MTRRKTDMADPVHRGLPLDEPKPTPGCGVCAALARDREQAKQAGNGSLVSDCNIELRNHPHGATR